jgi:hypothetical protein
MKSYLRQEATPWVSMAVLAGGLASACLLVFVYKVENNIQSIAADESAQYERIGERASQGR